MLGDSREGGREHQGGDDLADFHGFSLLALRHGEMVARSDELFRMLRFAAGRLRLRFGEFHLPER